MTDTRNKDETQNQDATEHTEQPVAKVEDRQNIIDTAVRFLKNPKVAQTAEHAKREFLSKKGLTPSEIKKALEQASAYSDSHPVSSPFANPRQNNQMAPYNQMGGQQQQVVKRSMWSVVFGWIRNFLIAGCLAYTAYKLIIKKYFLHNKKKQEKQKAIERLEATNQKLIDTMIEVKTSMSSVKEAVETVTRITAQKTVDMDDTGIRSEIQVIKNLLLNRSQFPNVPAVTPVLPSWQLENKNGKEKKLSESSRDEVITANEE